jgi:hypothetical protein
VLGIGFGRPDQPGVGGADAPDQEAAEGASADARIGGDRGGDRRPDHPKGGSTQVQPIAHVKTERVRERCLDDHAAGPDPGALRQLRLID